MIRKALAAKMAARMLSAALCLSLSAGVSMAVALPFGVHAYARDGVVETNNRYHYEQLDADATGDLMPLCFFFPPAWAGNRLATSTPI